MFSVRGDIVLIDARLMSQKTLATRSTTSSNTMSKNVLIKIVTDCIIINVVGIIIAISVDLIIIFPFLFSLH